MMLLEQILRYIMSMFAWVWRPSAKKPVEKLLPALGMLQNGNIEDRDLVLQRMIYELSSPSWSKSKDRKHASWVRDVIVRILYFSKPRAQNFGNLPQEAHQNDIQPKNHDSDEIQLLRLRREIMERSDRKVTVSALANAYWTLLSLCLFPSSSPPSDRLETNPDKIRYFDLFPLYGDGANGRLSDTGRGMLVPDWFNERYVAPLRPAVAALLILWNRNHNYIAHNLFIRFSESHGWTSEFNDSTQRIKQDNQIFEAAREINIMQFTNTIREDILKGLFSLSDVDASPELDILKDIPGVPTGISNDSASMLSQSFIESYFLYPRDPMIGSMDAINLEKLTGDDIRTTDADSLVRTFDNAASQAKKEARRGGHEVFCFIDDIEPMQTVRVENVGSPVYKDDDIARILMDAREASAGLTGGGESCPSYTTMIDRIALQRQRKWRSWTFNEFRKLYGLKALTSFEEWNPDPEISAKAQMIYGNIDNLGLYVGLQCEASIDEAAGKGVRSAFNFGYTKTHALLVDIVTRIRSKPPLNLRMRETVVTGPDRSSKLSAWVTNETTIKRPYGVNDDVLPKILQRHFPRYFPADRVISFCLFATPSAILRLGDPAYIKSREISMNTQRPDRAVIHTLTDHFLYKEVFNDSHDRFTTLYSNQLKLLTGNYGYLLGFDSDSVSMNYLKDLHKQDRQMTMFALIPDTSGTLKRYSNIFRDLTVAYISHLGVELRDGTFEIDIIADVINNVCTRWVCESLCDYPLGDDPYNEESIKKTRDMYRHFANLSTFIFKMFGHPDSYEARLAALESSVHLQNHIRDKIPKPDWLQTKKTSLQQLRGLLEAAYDTLQTILPSWFRRRGQLHVGSAQTFLRRVVQANRLIPLPKEKLLDMMDSEFQSLKNFAHSEKRNAGDVNKAERQVEELRVIANVLGLAAVSAVNIPQVCSLIVAYYLLPKNRTIREKIVTIVRRTDCSTEDINIQLSPYIYEALRICLPLGLWRKATGQFEYAIDGQRAIQIAENDLVFANFNQMHNQEPMFPEPQSVDPKRQREVYNNLFVMGVHKCPALTHKAATSFIDQVVPEVIREIFKLEGLRCAEGSSENIVTGIDHRPHLLDSPMYPKLYNAGMGELSYYPQTLRVQYTKRPQDSEYYLNRDKFDIETGLSWSLNRIIIELIEYGVGAMTTLWITYRIAVTIYAILAVILLALGLGPRAPRLFKVPHMSDVQPQSIMCRTPLTIWDDWAPHTLKGGRDGIPLDITFNTSLPVAHQLQIYDADKKDTKLAIYVDDVLRALSSDFELDKTIDCADDAYQCYLEQFSFGSVIVASGTHSTRVSWAGKELANGTYPDLGKNASRRILIKRDYCAS